MFHLGIGGESMKSLFVGIGIVTVTLLISIFSHDLTHLYKITGGVTVALLVMCISNLGAFPDVDGIK